MKKILIPFVVLCVMAISLSACSGKSKNDKYSAGKYKGEALGYGGDVEVEVEVDASTIKSVTVTSNSETEGLGSVAIEKIPPQIVEKQGTEGVEKVAGATKSSDAIISAVNSALDKASGVNNKSK